MPPRNHWIPIALLLLGVLSACGQKVEFEADSSTKSSSRSWRKVIRKATQEPGVDYDFIASRPRHLERYLAWAATHGQHKDWWGESREDKRISHLANSHNAMMIHAILENRPLTSPDEINVGVYRWPGAGVSRGLRYRLDGEWVTLEKLRSMETVARYQDPLLWLLFHDGTMESPPLQWWPEKGLQSRLKKMLRDLLKTDAWLSQTEDGWAAHPLFFEHERDFTEWGEKQSLCDWLSTYASGEAQVWLETHADDCPLERLPSDRRLNQTDE